MASQRPSTTTSTGSESTTDARGTVATASATRPDHLEYPVIADVNGDGHAEIVVASNDYGWLHDCPTDAGPDPCTRHASGSGRRRRSRTASVSSRAPVRDWVSTRRIWNQHAYHVTHVDEDGRVTSPEMRNWTVAGLNNFRQNIQPGASNAPDLVVSELSVDIRACPRTMVLYARIRNAGWAGAIGGVPVRAAIRRGGRNRDARRGHVDDAVSPAG